MIFYLDVKKFILLFCEISHCKLPTHSGIETNKFKNRSKHIKISWQRSFQSSPVLTRGLGDCILRYKNTRYMGVLLDASKSQRYSIKLINMTNLTEYLKYSFHSTDKYKQ